MPLRRDSAQLLVVLAVLCAAPNARSDPDDEKAQCSEEHAESQKLRRTGKLLDARKLLLRCARPSCPDVVRKECSEWATELETSIPTIVVEVVGKNGRRTSDARVTIDDAAVTQRLSGLEVPVDPGDHMLEVRLASGERKEESIHLDVGDRARRVSVDFSEARQKRTAPAPVSVPGPSPHEASSGPPAVSWLLGAIGLAAIGSFAYLGLKARSQASDLEACKPNCPRADSDAMRRNALFADLSLGVSAVSFGLAGYFWASSGNGHASTASGVVGSRSAMLQLGGRF